MPGGSAELWESPPRISAPGPSRFNAADAPRLLAGIHQPEGGPGVVAELGRCLDRIEATQGVAESGTTLISLVRFAEFFFALKFFGELSRFGEGRMAQHRTGT